MTALPLSRHDWHGDWNYTLRPEEHHRDGAPPIPPQNQPGPGRDWLTLPALTGMRPDQWEQLVNELAVARQLQREEDLHQRRGGDRQKTPATGLYTGRRPGLTLVDRLLATILYQRFRIPQFVIAPLFTITPATLNRAISQTRRLLHDIGHAIEPAETQLATLDDKDATEPTQPLLWIGISLRAPDSTCGPPMKPCLGAGCRFPPCGRG